MGNATFIKFGERVTLSDGSTPILRDFHDTAGAFFEYDKPVQTAVFANKNGKREWVANLGLADRAWVRAPGWTVARDRDGCKIGMVYKQPSPSYIGSIPSDFRAGFAGEQ